MLQAIKKLSAVTSLMALSACASLFSAYDSEFSCKNSEHGECTHPFEAYEQARTESRAGYNPAPVERVEDDLDASDHRPVLTRNDYQTYQDKAYEELGNLIVEPATPVLAPAKTVRTLILPYGDPKGGQRLYMPRYVYSVLENPRFVLGNYLLKREAGLSLEALLGAGKPGQGKEG